MTSASAIGMAGALLASWPLSRATHWVGWRPAMMAATVMMLCATIGVAWFVKRRDASPHASHSTVHHPAPWNGRFKTLAPACLSMSVGGTFRTSWGGPYLADVFRFDLIARGNALTITSVVGATASFCIPLLVRFWTPKLLPLLWLVMGALAAITLAAIPATSSVMGVGLICVLFSVGAINPLVMSQARAVVTAHRLGFALGLLNTFVFLGIALASACFGWLAGEARHMHTTAAQVTPRCLLSLRSHLRSGRSSFSLAPAL